MAKSMDELRKEAAERQAKGRLAKETEARGKRTGTTEDKPAEKPVETPSSDGKKKVLEQNVKDTATAPQAPEVAAPSRRDGVTRVTVDRRDEKEQRRFERDRDEWNRQKRIQRLEALDREWRQQQSRSGFGAARFTTTFNGHRARTTGSWRSSGFGTDTRGRSPYAAELDRELGGDPGSRGSSSSTTRTSPAMDWMPKDTAEKGTRFGQNDFFGRDSRDRSSRYSGGYMSPEFRENFITSRMDGLNPGDAGYDQARRRAEGAWGAAVRQYDRQFQQYGQEKLREQSRLDYQKKQQDLIKQRQDADAAVGRKVESVTGAKYDRSANAQGTDLTNAEVERAVAEAARNSALQTGVRAEIAVGTKTNTISATSYGNAERGVKTFTKVGDSSGLKSATVGVTSTTPAERPVGATVGGGVEMNRDRVAQTNDVLRRGGGDPVMKSALKSDDGTFELITGEKRIASSGKTQGGRYAGGGTIVFGDQKTFDQAVDRNRKRSLV